MLTLKRPVVCVCLHKKKITNILDNLMPELTARVFPTIVRLGPKPNEPNKPVLRHVFLSLLFTLLLSSCRLLSAPEFPHEWDSSECG